MPVIAVPLVVMLFRPLVPFPFLMSTMVFGYRFLVRIPPVRVMSVDPFWMMLMPPPSIVPLAVVFVPIACWCLLDARKPPPMLIR